MTHRTVKDLESAVHTQDTIIAYYLNLQRTYEDRRAILVEELQEVQGRLDKLDSEYNGSEEQISIRRRLRMKFEQERRLRANASGGAYPAERRRKMTKAEKLKMLKAQVELLERQVSEEV